LLPKGLESTFSSAVTTLHDDRRAKTGKKRSITTNPETQKKRKGQSVPPPQLEQYAYICAEVAAFPERAFEVWTRNGVPDEASHRVLEANWVEAFRHDPELYRRFMVLYGQYFRDWRGAR